MNMPKAGLLLILLLVCALAAGAENDLNNALIGSVSVMIDDLPAGESIEKLIAVQPGEFFSLKKINFSIKQIYKTGLFSDVRVVREGEERIRLTFLLTSRPFSRGFTITGMDSAPRSRLTNKVYSVRTGEPYTEERLLRSVEELREAMSDEGMFEADIHAYAEKVEGSTQVDVFFDIRSAKTYSVSRILFSGMLLFTRDQLLHKMGTKEGGAYAPSALREDVLRLEEFYLSEDYRRAEVRVLEPDFDEENGRVSLTVEVTPNEKIVVHIDGASVPVDLIKPIWEAQIFEEWGLDEGEAKIIGYLRDRGHIFATVFSSIERRENEIHVIHKVAPGRKVGVQDIEFRGLEHFTEDQLKRELLISGNIPLLSKIPGSRLFQLSGEMEFLYKTRGFPETDVQLQFEWQGEKKVKPIYIVSEGRQETVAQVTFEGASLFPPADLQSRIGSSQGGAYYQPSVQLDIEKLLIFYRNQGVRGTEIVAAAEMVEEDRFAVNFQVREGERVIIQEIVISGHDITRLGVITRELQVREGELARYDAIRETKRRLEGLGVFSEVRIEEIQLSPDTMNLFIQVSEGDRHHVSAGLGLETAGAPHSADVWNYDVRLRGTGEIIRQNLFGRAATLSLVGQLSIREQRVVATWQQPYFFGIPINTFLNAWWEQEQRTSFRYERIGVSLSGIRTFKGQEYWTLVPTLKFARTTILELEIEEDEIDRQFLPYSTTSIGGSVLRDRRDDPFNPLKGYFFSTALEWAYPLFNTESNFLKLFSKYQRYFPVGNRIQFAFTSRLGLGSGHMPIPERFFAGGSNSFRGTRYDELGPKDPVFGNPVGGKALFLLNFELVLPIFSQLENLGAVFFYDTGNVWTSPSQISLNDMEHALGLGLRYRTPLGPVRFEFGWNLDAAPGESKTLVFITIGNMF
jgi:outer membrane protein insertion porin family